MNEAGRHLFAVVVSHCRLSPRQLVGTREAKALNPKPASKRKPERHSSLAGLLAGPIVQKLISNDTDTLTIPWNEWLQRRDIPINGREITVSF